MPAIAIVDNFQAIQYTGSNSAEIDGLITDFTITSESGGVLNFTSQFLNLSANTGDWIRFRLGQVEGVFSSSAFSAGYAQYPTQGSFDALAGNVSTLSATVTSLGVSTAQSVGIGEVPTLLLNATAVVPVTLLPAMPSSSYTVNRGIFAPAGVLANITITATSIVSSSLVNVTVQNTGLASLSGARVLVVAKA